MEDFGTVEAKLEEELLYGLVEFEKEKLWLELVEALEAISKRHELSPFHPFRFSKNSIETPEVLGLSGGTGKDTRCSAQMWASRARELAFGEIGRVEGTGTCEVKEL